jgi:3-oxo-5-alpha-steroid 4-dehydrogenase 1
MTWYTGDPTYDTVLTAGLAAVVLTALTSLFFIAPYGRFASSRVGLNLDPRLGWFLMELPSTLSFLYFYLAGPRRGELVPLVFAAVWLIHYANRGFIFPALMRVPRGQKKSFSLLVVVTGWAVTTVHGYLVGAYLSSFGRYGSTWLTDPRFLVGIGVYYAALAGNIHADAILRNLRTRREVLSGSAPYRIPRGGLFRHVSSPSYFYELLAWCGFALATYTLGAVFVLGMSLANLVPRAGATHRWYREKFDDYPAERKALIPFIW